MTCLYCNTRMYANYLYCNTRMYATCPLSTCVHLRKTRVSNFLELRNFWPFRPLMPLSHQLVPCHRIQTATDQPEYIPYHQPYVDLYHVINEASPTTYACPSCIHHHTIMHASSYNIDIPQPSTSSSKI